MFDLRDYNNLTQKAVGELLGVRQQSYGEWEKGYTTILTAFAYQIAKEYNISIDWLVGASKEMKRS